MKRLPPVAGEWLRRDRRLSFSFESRTYEGVEGDTVTSALLANGIRVLGRSFKYHRPRSVLSAANHDANILMQLGPVPNVRADVTPLQEGMRLSAVNVHGSVARDRGRLLDRLSAFLPVGFYYKAFHSRLLFSRWEALIRWASGLGVIDITANRRFTAKRYDYCDVLVVGAGAAGLSAALTAADTGARVVVVDENTRPGGSAVYDLAGGTPDERVQSLLARVASHPAISLRTGTSAAGWYSDHWIPLVDGDRITKLRARAVIAATGTFEQPAVFRNNDLPGVMLGSAALRLIHRYAVKPFSRVVVLTANEDGYRAALDFLAHDIEVAAVVDLRPDRATSPAAGQVAARSIAIHAGHCIREAEGDGQVAAVVLSRHDGHADTHTDASHAIRIDCDGVAMSVGWAPAAGLLYQAGTAMRFDAAVGQFVPNRLPDGVFAAGRVNGVFGLEQRIGDGARAGHAAAAHLGLVAAVDSAPMSPVAPLAPPPEPRSHPWPIVAHPRGKNFVDFDEDLQLKDFEHAVQEGFDNIELLKRYTTVGMGPSQGKHSNMNAIRILARLRGEPVDAIGSTTSRPFHQPIPLAQLAGRGFVAERETPLQGRHLAAGAVMMPAGNWSRPEYYAIAGRTREEAIHDEVRAVRASAGLIDIGTLGKIEISGPDAGAFLERVYTGRFANMRPGTTRYGVMLDESAVVIDDGVVARLDADRYYFTTTTSGSATVYRELSRLNTLWQMNCGIVNITGHMAAVNLAGPRSRELLQGLTGADLADTAFPYLAARAFDIAGIPARVLRIGFVGELGYEIHVAADQGCALWDALLGDGTAFALRPFGVEAQRLLRLEKGHIIIGQDTDGLTNPDEAGVAWAVKMDKPFFVCQRSLAIRRKQPPRQTLAGVHLEGTGADKVRECHLVIDGGDIAGRVTSVAWSPTLGRHIGLAMLSVRLVGQGTRLSIRTSDGALVAATVVPTPFYDAAGLRQKPAQPELSQAA